MESIVIWNRHHHHFVLCIHDICIVSICSMLNNNTQKILAPPISAIAATTAIEKVCLFSFAISNWRDLFFHPLPIIYWLFDYCYLRLFTTNANTKILWLQMQKKKNECFWVSQQIIVSAMKCKENGIDFKTAFIKNFNQLSFYWTVNRFFGKMHQLWRH